MSPTKVERLARVMSFGYQIKRLEERLADQWRELDLEQRRNGVLRRRVASLELENAELHRQLEERR